MNNNGLCRALAGGYWVLLPDGWVKVSREEYIVSHTRRPTEDNTGTWLPLRLLLALAVTVGALILWGRM